MRKLIITVAAMMMVLAVAAGANDLNCSEAWAGAVTLFDPSTIVEDTQLKKLIDNCDAVLNPAERTVINTDDNNWWTYPNGDEKLYAYMILKFEKPEGYDAGTCYWQAKLQNQGSVYVYRWRFTGDEHSWDDDPEIPEIQFMDRNYGGSNPATSDFFVDEDYFDENHDDILYLLIKGYANGQDLIIDVCDIQWFEL